MVMLCNQKEKYGLLFKENLDMSEAVSRLSKKKYASKGMFVMEKSFSFPVSIKKTTTHYEEVTTKRRKQELSYLHGTHQVRLT